MTVFKALADRHRVKILNRLLAANGGLRRSDGRSNRQSSRGDWAPKCISAPKSTRKDRNLRTSPLGRPLVRTR
jgi:hypothetical protein